MQVGDDIDGDDNMDEFGHSVAMSDDGNTVVVGAPGGDATFADVGEARVFHFNGSNWIQLGGDMYGEAVDDRFGRSVSMSSDGNTVVIGAPFNDGTGTNAGHARVYRLDAGNWSQLGGDIDGEAESDLSGEPVAMSDDGDTVVVGAFLNDGSDTNAGHARIYRLDSGNWTQLGGDIDGEAAGDWSGKAVAVSSDGNTVIIGAEGNKEAGYSAGHARVFRFDGTSWTQLGMDLDGDMAYDFFGHSVAMSSSGNTVVLGGIGNSATGNSAGRARVYRLQCVTP